MQLSSAFHTCGLCESDFRKRVYFVQHIKSKIIENQNLCNSCGKVVPYLQHLEEHVRNYHTLIIPFYNVIRLFFLLNYFLGIASLPPASSQMCAAEGSTGFRKSRDGPSEEAEGTTRTRGSACITAAGDPSPTSERLD